MKWSLRTKFLMVMSTLLASGLGTYLLMAANVFKTDKTQLVFDLNRSQVANLTSEMETQFGGVSEKLKVFALLPPAMQTRLIDELLTESSDVVGISIFKAQSGSRRAEREFHQNTFLETYGLPEDFFRTAQEANPIPLDAILKEGEDVWNASVANGPPLIGYGRLVIVQDQRGVPVEQWAVVAYIKLDRFLKAVSIVRVSDIVVLNRRGEVLVQPDSKTLIERPRLNDNPLFKEALESKTKVSVVHREYDGKGVLAAFGKGFNNQIFVVAQTSEAEVFKVVKDLSIGTMLFGSIILTIVILAGYLLSQSLTENIALLTERMEAVADGDLSTQIRLKGRDETVTLANTFNQMIVDLKSSRDALETMNRELDQKVKDRTEQLEIQNRKVQEVQEALLRTTRLASVGEIAGRTAHEVLNPLTILLTRVGLMQKRMTEDRQAELSLLQEIRQAWKQDYTTGGFEKLIKAWQERSKVNGGQNLFEEDLANLQKVIEELGSNDKALSDDIKFVKDEGERIGKIINSMRKLGVSRSDSKAQSVHAVLTDCCHIMNDLFEQKGLHIEQNFQATQDLCQIDRDEMIQATTNLMRNSLHALEGLTKKDGHLILKTYNENGQLFIDICDNGEGIKPEHQKRLFESSFTTKTPEQGTGLGLGIARRFVRGQGGDIEFIKSEPQSNTVFRIRLPLEAAESKRGAVA